MEEFKKCVIDLFTNHGMDKHSIYKLVKSTIIEHVSHLPKIRVLYNAEHGSFGFSDEFIQFYNKRFSEYDRIKPIPYLIPFADHILAKFADLSPVFAVMETYPIESVFQNISQINIYEQHISNIYTNIDIIRKYLATNPEHSPDARNVTYDDIFLEISVTDDIYRYNVDGLAALLARYDECPYKYLASKLKYIQELKNDSTILLSEEVIEDMSTYMHIYDDIKPTKICNYDEFVKLLETRGTRDVETWKSQLYYEPVAIMYLLSLVDKGILHEVFPRAGRLSDVGKETFGLLCASGKYAKLQITEVPAGVDWEVREYDGLETIVI